MHIYIYVLTFTWVNTRSPALLSVALAFSEVFRFEQFTLPAGDGGEPAATS